jgi:protein gp37
MSMPTPDDGATPRRVARTTSIEWTDATWNPTTGCDRVSAGCDHCYAMTLAPRLKAMGSAALPARRRPAHQRPGLPRPRVHPTP